MQEIKLTDSQMLYKVLYKICAKQKSKALQEAAPEE